jgi:hypothetical protein
VGRSVADERQWSSVAGLALLLLATLSCLLWALGNGIPYGYDSSGTYQTYRAAYNATTFSGENPFVADISTSPDPATHPVYDRARPDAFGQLLSQLLLRSGIADLRVQTGLAIAVSILGIFLAIKVLRRTGGAALAAVATLLFALQYVGVLTWTTNLQTALYFPLFWGNLYVLQRYVDRPSVPRLLALSLGVVAAFLNDLGLGAFVLLTELFLFWQLPRPVHAKLQVLASLVAGGVAALVALVFAVGPGALAGVWGPSAGDQLGQLPSAYRAMFDLGQGAVTLVVYPLLLVALVAAGWTALSRVAAIPGPARGLRVETIALMVTAAAIAGALWIDRSTALVGDWEPILGRPIVHVGLWLALVGLLIAIGVSVIRGRHLAAEARDVQPGSDVFTTRSFVVAVGLAALLLSLVSIGGFVETFVRNYQPAVVFLEDVVLAALVLAAIRKIREGGWSLQSVAIAAVLFVVGSYWVAYQGRLAVRYPPREIGVATALRANVVLAGADIVAPELPQVVWYYTHGRVLPADAAPAPSAAQSFAVCVRAPTDAPAPTACGASAVGAGQVLAEAPDYLISAVPQCATLGGSSANRANACGPGATAPPTLDPLGNVADASRVDLTVTLDATGSLAHVDYQFAQAAGTPEAESIVRLYVLKTRPTTSWCLIDEAAGTGDIHFPPTAAGQFRAAVIPRSTLAAGNTYFSDAQDVRSPYVFDLPNIRDGGVQHITAYTWEEAEQKALDAGTWNPSAGTLGPDSKTPLVDAPSADHLCRS